MSEFKLYNIKKVVEFHQITNVNEYLKLGWILIETYKSLEHPRFQDQMMNYVLGWAKDEDPVYPKSKYKVKNTNEG